MSKAKAFAPATVANVAVGFDILGFAVSGIGETAEVSVLKDPPRSGVVIDPVENFTDIPLDPLRNTAGAGLVRLIKEKRLDHGFRLRLQKTIPIGSGLGGSAASAVASVTAANALLRKKLSFEEILDYALTGEEVASGSRHADNVGPCLAGGLVFVRSAPRLRLVRVPTPKTLRCVLMLPKLSIKTSEARKLLKPQLALKTAIAQTANLTGFLLACVNADFGLMGESLRDAWIEPQRARLIPGFYDLQKAALAAGALGCSISGSGPAIFALASGPRSAGEIERALRKAANRMKLELAGSWITPIASGGACVLGKKG